MRAYFLRPILCQVIFSYSVTAFFIYDQLYEGNPCLLEDGKTGICKKLPDCPLRMEEVMQGKRNADSSGRCGFEDFVEIVCCPVKNVTQKLIQRPADVACQQYENEVMIDDRRSDTISLHIFGGTEAQSGEFPYMAALGYEIKDDDGASTIGYSCGGTLISSQHVLTAAHCVTNIDERVPVEVRLGTEDIKSTIANSQRIPVSDVVYHPRYKRSTNYNDVAILKLKTKVQFTNTIKPICLQTKPVERIDTASNTSVVVIGWGSTSFDNEGTNKLMKTPSLSIVDKDTCSDSYRNLLNLPDGLDDNMLCALDVNTTVRADACQGDSGGPLLLLSDAGDSIIGVTAFGQSCGGPVPGVYMAVYPYLDWIEEQVWSSTTKD